MLTLIIYFFAYFLNMFLSEEPLTQTLTKQLWEVDIIIIFLIVLCDFWICAIYLRRAHLYCNIISGLSQHVSFWVVFIAGRLNY